MVSEVAATFKNVLRMSHTCFATCPQVDKRRKRKITLSWFDDNMDFPELVRKILREAVVTKVYIRAPPHTLNFLKLRLN